MLSYQDFTITVNGSIGSYTVEARGPGEITVSPLPFIYAETGDLRSEFDQIKNGFAPSRERMQAVGALLFDALFPRPIARAFSRAYGHLSEGANLRLKLAIRPPELNVLPWELLYDPDEAFFLAARLSYPIVRFLESGAPAASLLTRRPLNVLYVQAQPADLVPLNLEASERAIRDALGAMAQVTPLRQASPEALTDALRQPCYHILHYDGHAGFDADSASGMVGLQDPQTGHPRYLSGELLAALLEGSSIRLVVLAACESGMDSPKRRFSGIAQQLLRASSLPAVVAMQFAIPDRSAIAFNHGFYGALAADFPVDAAVTEGRKAILTSFSGEPFDTPDWATPVLFMRASDGDIFARGESLPAAGVQLPLVVDHRRIGVNIENANVSGMVVGGNVILEKSGGIPIPLIEALFIPMTQIINQTHPDRQVEAGRQLSALVQELAKGGTAEDNILATLASNLAGILPEMSGRLADILSLPILANAIGSMTRSAIQQLYSVS